MFVSGLLELLLPACCGCQEIHHAPLALQLLNQRFALAVQLILPLISRMHFFVGEPAEWRDYC